MAEPTLDELRLSFIELKRLIVEEYCDADPSVLYAQAKSDEQLRRYCAELDGIATSLRRHELSAKGGFIAPVSDAYIQAWNDYRERWQKPVGKVQSYQLDPYIANALYLARANFKASTRATPSRRFLRSRRPGFASS